MEVLCSSLFFILLLHKNTNLNVIMSANIMQMHQLHAEQPAIGSYWVTLPMCGRVKVSVQVMVFWVVMPCCLHLQDKVCFTLKMEAAEFSKSLVSYHITDHNLNSHHHESLKYSKRFKLQSHNKSEIVFCFCPWLMLKNSLVTTYMLTSLFYRHRLECLDWEIHRHAV
jgi:hypothetical protein